MVSSQAVFLQKAYTDESHTHAHIRTYASGLSHVPRSGDVRAEKGESQTSD